MPDTGFQVKATSGFGRPEDFRIEEDMASHDSVRVFVLYGELDLNVASELRERLNEAIDESGQNLVVDLSTVSFVDSMALGVLLGTLKRLRSEGRELRLVVPGPKLRRIFEMTLLDQVFELSGTRQEALAALAS